MGVGSRSHAWRFSGINHDYEVSSTFSPSCFLRRRPLSNERLTTQLSVLSYVSGQDRRTVQDLRHHTRIRRQVSLKRQTAWIGLSALVESGPLLLSLFKFCFILLDFFY